MARRIRWGVNNNAKNYQTAAGVSNKVEITSRDSITFPKSDQHSNEHGGFSCFWVSGCCFRFSSFHEARTRYPKGTTGDRKVASRDQKMTTWRPLGPTLGPLGGHVGRRGAQLGRLCAHLGHPWVTGVHLEPLGAHLDALGPFGVTSG